MKRYILILLLLTGCSYTSLSGRNIVKRNNSTLIKIDEAISQRRGFRLGPDNDIKKNSHRPEVGVDASGNSIVLFEKFDKGKNRIYAVRANRDSVWGEPEPIDNGKGDAYRPYITMKPDGRATAVFVQDESGYSAIYAVSYSSLSGWGRPVRIDAGQQDADGIHAIMDNNGDTHVVFEQMADNLSRIFYTRYNSKKKVWDKPDIVSDDNAMAYYPQIALWDKNFVISFVQQTGDEFSMFVRIYTAGKGWGKPIRIDTIFNSRESPYLAESFFRYLYASELAKSERDGVDPVLPHNGITRGSAYKNSKVWGLSRSKIDTRNRHANTPRIAVDNNSNKIFIIFKKWDGQYFRIAAHIYNIRDAAGNTYLIDGKRMNGDQPSIMVDSYGRAVALFVRQSGKRENDFVRIHAATYTPASGWRSPVVIDEGTGDAYGPRLVITAHNRFVAAWCQWKNEEVRSFILRYDFNNGWTKPEITNPDRRQTCGTRVAANDRGVAVTVFEQEDKEEYDNNIYTINNIYAVRYKIE